MLDELLSIRQVRQDRAQQRVAAQQDVVKYSWQQVLQAKDDLERFQKWRPEREEQLFAEAKTQTFTRKTLDEFQQKIASLRQEEAEKAKTLTAKENTHQKEKEQLISSFLSEFISFKI